ncbi:GAF domain-containing sensor histidine kinase [Melghirimyces algeriensis]|uniref:histidine kinase n=1 Tax=Melghirimyces algeriensis TaxID=910412 RepID=A0A521EI99_9BACL|nr:GAF domain-containing sensor histidine kinase [Melghirimyces algeriensis]SMO83201.1 hypothetical protein SAMN06264849_10953 [Melghirimyces algeriensis]
MKGKKAVTENIQSQQWKMLRTIAETLNQSTEVQPMLQSVLEELLDVTGLSTGWIFLTDKFSLFETVAVQRIPPGLSWERNRPLCEGSCWCLNKYWKGTLNQAVNIIECKRLDDALKYHWGDTWGITHHATIPLTAGSQRIGLLNVTSPGKERFSDEELALLEAFAYQIGMAVQKTRLIQVQKRRAQQYARLDQASRAIWAIRDIDHLPEQAICEVDRSFPWPFVAMWVNKGNRMQLVQGKKRPSNVDISLEIPDLIRKSFEKQQLVLVREDESLEHFQSFWPDCTGVIAVPVSTQTERIGVLSVGGIQGNEVEEDDSQVVKALGKHLSLAMESARLEEKRQQLTVSQERNRLARDLHDSVNQKLFSLSLSAQAIKEFPQEEKKLFQETLQDIQDLSQEALKEMRALIWQLRPPGLEAGIMTALRNYAHQLGLRVKDEVEGVDRLPGPVEEALWRIGQEALNNVSRHAGTDQVILRLKVKEGEVRLEVIDFGKGFSYDSKQHHQRTFGMTSMKERAEMLGGSFYIESIPGERTVCRTVIPIRERGMKDDSDSDRG